MTLAATVPVAPVEQTPRCANCDQPLAGPYCAACGQRAADLHVSIWHLISEALQEAFEFDSRVRRTIAPFLFKPGFLADEYLAGRRIRYSSPFRIYLLFSFLFFLVARLAGGPSHPPTPVPGAVTAVAADDEEIKLGPLMLSVKQQPLEKTESPTAHEWRRRFRERVKALKVNDPTGERRLGELWNELPRVAFFLLPIFALLLKMLFGRSGRNYVGHLILTLHLHAFAFLVLLPTALTGNDVLMLGGMALAVVYGTVAVHRFYRQRWVWTIPKVLTLGLLYLVPLTLGTAVALLLTVWLT